MKKAANNQFGKGLITDLNPLSTPPDVLVEAKNIDFVTTEGNQVILQKRMGNDPSLWNDEGTETIVTLSEGFVPIMVKELNNIAYIISVKEDTTYIGEIGTFPSPLYDDFVLNLGTPDTNPTLVDITSTFDDGLSANPDFTLNPPSIENVYAVVGEYSEYLFSINNNATIPDNIGIVTDSLLEPSTSIVPVNPLGSSTFPVVVNTSTIGYYKESYVKGISATDPTVTDTSPVYSITISDGVSAVETTYRSCAEDNGGNIKGTDIWNYVDTNPTLEVENPIFEFTFAFPSGFSPKDVKFKMQNFDAGWTRTVPDFEILEYYSTFVATPQSTPISINDSNVVKVQFLNIATLLPDSATVQSVYLTAHIDTAGEPLFTWEGDIDYGLSTDFITPFIRYFNNPAVGGLKQWQWGQK